MLNRWMYAGIAALAVVLLIGGTYWLRDRTAEDSPESASLTETETTPGSGSQSPPDSDSDASPDAGTGPATGAPGTNPADPGAPVPQLAAPGAELQQVTEPPGRTIAMFDPEAMPVDTRLSVEFQPFGIGPWGEDSLVIRLQSVSVISGDVRDPSRLEGANVIVRLEPPAARRVSQGGSYTATLRAVPDQDVTILSVVEAEPVER